MRGEEERRVALFIVMTVMRIDSERETIQAATAEFQTRDDCLHQGCADEDRSGIGEKNSAKYYLFSWNSYS